MYRMPWEDWTVQGLLRPSCSGSWFMSDAQVVEREAQRGVPESSPVVKAQETYGAAEGVCECNPNRCANMRNFQWGFIWSPVYP